MLDTRPLKLDASTTLRLLVVEDDPDDRSWLDVMLGNATVCAYTTSDATSVAQAETMLTVQPFDCVLLDLSLPDSQGLDSLRRIRTAAPETPVVVFTQQDDLDLGLALIDAGAQEYLVKGKARGSETLRAALFSAARVNASQGHAPTASTGTRPPPAAIDDGSTLFDRVGLTAISAPWVCLDGDAAIVATCPRFHDLVATTDATTNGIAFATFLDPDSARDFAAGFRRFQMGDTAPFVRRVNLVSIGQLPLPAMLTATPVQSPGWNGVLVLITPGRRATAPAAGS